MIYWSQEETKKNSKERLLEVLNRLNTQGLKLNYEKCKFNKDEVSWLDCVLNDKGIEADDNKTKEIQKLTRPTTKQELRSFL